jgi:pseudouridine-5'-phosphate glycosidase
MSALRFSAPVAQALASGGPVVALESSVLAQGLPIPDNSQAAIRMMGGVRRSGATPAITAVVSGRCTVGLTDEELERFLDRRGIRKVAARDLAVAMVHELHGATTVSASLCIAGATEIKVFATGGIGGVHRNSPFDESGDLVELSRTPMVVVCAGAKAILDLPATLERLETLGVTVVGYRTNELPGFFTRTTGLHIASRAETPDEVAAMYRASRALGRRQALLVVQPPPDSVALPQTLVDRAVVHALEQASHSAIHGPALTPFLLAAVLHATEGRSLWANLGLLEENATLAGAIAVSLATDGEGP